MKVTESTIKSQIQNIKQKITDLKEEFENTPVQDQYSVSTLRGAVNAGLWGSIIGGPILGASSVAGATIGNLVGKKTQNPLISIIASTISSATIFTLLSLSMGTFNPISTAIGAISSAITSNIGNLSSTASKEMNNINDFSQKMIPIGLTLNLPPTLLATSTLSSQLPHIFDIDEKKKFYLALLFAAGLGLSLGMIGGPTNAAIFAALNSLLTTANFKLSSKVENFYQKASNFLSNRIAKVLIPRLSFLSKLPDKLKATIAGLIVGSVSTLGALTLAGIIYPILGPITFAIPLSVFLLTSFSTGKKILDIKNIQQNTQNYIDKIYKAIQQNDIQSAVYSYKELFIKNLELSDFNDDTHKKLKSQIEELSIEELKQMMFNELYNLHISNSIQKFINNDISEAVDELRKAMIIERLLAGDKYQEAQNLVNSIPQENIIHYIQDLINKNQEAK